MRFHDLFRTPQGMSARYVSASPLFPFGTGQFPLAAGSYRNGAGDSVLSFRIETDRYKIAGNATPDTVLLIPVAGRADGYVFQQSDGPGATYYGALRLLRWETGFSLFSPEVLPADAIRAAGRNGATIGLEGCSFTSQAALLSALVPLAFDAPDARWHVYHPV
jgi:hypothetical protein